MARKIGSVCRLCRTQGEKLFLKGARCTADKCAIGKRQLSPGQHGVSVKRKKMSNYAVQLREKQKVKRIYGLLEKQFKNYFKKADNSRGVTGDMLLQFLERRLDNVVYRANFAESRARARQLVRHRFVKVNGRKVNIPSYMVSVGDEVVMSGSDDQLKAIKESAKVLMDARAVPEWIESSAEVLAMKVKKLPTKADVGMPIEENLIIELYSK
ncbi:MAG TPA: 30S ribosomal protein S4 [Candidatus Omnitrophota bacterium]|nr:30S ribosomal protein S4 [Candidatus Omnitrophota bacterium]